MSTAQSGVGAGGRMPQVAAARGWLLHPLGTDAVAVGEFELAHLMPESPERFIVPGAPPFCRQAIIWNDRPLPLIDLAVRVYGPQVVRGAASTREFIQARVAVLRFAAASNGAQTSGSAGGVQGSAQDSDTTEYGAIGLRALPVRVTVRDDQAVELPRSQADWRQFSLSCFEHADGTAIPILHLEQLFGAAKA